MPPQPLMPHRPAGAPDWFSPSGFAPTYGSPVSTPSATSGAGMSWYPSQNFGELPSSSFPSNFTSEDIRRWIASMDAKQATLNQQWQQTSGLERRKVEAEIKDLEEGRKQALELAQITERTSRYGTDVASRDRMIALTENMRQFDANHGLELSKLGLSRAQTATDFLSTPDRFVQAGDFLNLSSRVLANQGGGNTYGSAGAPQMKTMKDYAVLEGGGTPGRQQVDPSSAAAAGGSGADQRVKALRAVIDAAPPSEGDGIDNNGYAVLNAARAIYSMNLNPKQQAAISGSKEYQAMLGSAGRRLGHRPDEWWQQQQKTLPYQGSARSA